MVDKHKLEDMLLWAVSTGDLYTEVFFPIQRNLYNKYVQNEYDNGQAVKAFQHIIQKIILKHNAEMLDQYRLSREERLVLAEDLCDHFTRDFCLHPTGGLFDA